MMLLRHFLGDLAPADCSPDNRGWVLIFKIIWSYIMYKGLVYTKLCKIERQIVALESFENRVPLIFQKAAAIFFTQ